MSPADSNRYNGVLCDKHSPADHTKAYERTFPSLKGYVSCHLVGYQATHASAIWTESLLEVDENSFVAALSGGSSRWPW